MMVKTNGKVTLRRSKIHGQGVFAKRDIRKGARIIEYKGEKLTKAQADKRADIPLERHKNDRRHGAVYLFKLNRWYDIDGDVPYNSARFINHSCEPNAEAEIDGDRIWIIALRDIKKGEEIFYNYGYDFEDFHEHPCFCRTNSCVGYILAEEHWPRLRRRGKRAGTKKPAS